MSQRKKNIGFIIGSLLRRKKLAFISILEPFGITPRQYAVLFSLWEEGRQPLTELATRLYADASSLSRIVLLLEKSGLIQRRRDENDRRVFRLMLAPRGEVLMQQIWPLVEAHEARMLRGISKDEIERVAAAMQKMIANLSAPSVDDATTDNP